MESNLKRHQKFGTDLLIPIEQWIAFVIGIACLTVFFWSAMDGYEAPSVRHKATVSAAILMATGWLLTIALGSLEVRLTRFKVQRNGEPEPDAKSRIKRIRIGSGGSTGTPITSIHLF